MKKIVLFFMLIGLGLTLNSCYYNKFPIVDPNPPAVDISFATEIQPIFNNNCVACHNGSLDPDLRTGNSYNALTSIPGSIIPGDASGSELIEMLEHNPANPNPMPPSSPISTTKITLIKNWINQGAKNN